MSSQVSGVETDAPKRDIDWILSILPHRYPILLVDRVLELEPKRRIVAIKNVTINEPVFLGHFPQKPVMPGVFLIEGLAQAGGLLLLSEMPDRDRKLLFFAGIEEAKFRRPVVPGDQIRYEVEVLRLRSTFCRFSGKVLVDGQVAAEAILSSAMVDR
ncbi:MAG TPA: 3-hydroxyacyl-ACP dehydratase FabZ [Thermoanaerobaculia bacterium]|jgi:3-hydroxyacyl-[acyl-carrier-protein] dehydratase|nr:3-hydroxyacyl-ACP dehydratase FabZ [Thermoanaerobaculia bacterium]